MERHKTYYFPWVRKGLGRFFTERDTLGKEGQNDALVERGKIQLTAKFKANSVADKEAKKKSLSKSKEIIFSQSKTISVLGPGDILSVNKNAIIKTVPYADSVGYSKDYLPYIEFWEPDFLWRYTPAAVNETEKDNDDKNKTRLRPWLMLIVCKTSLCKFAQSSDGRSTVSLSLGNEAEYEEVFVHPQDVWRAAHAQGYQKDCPDFCRLIAIRRDEFDKQEDNYPNFFESGVSYTALLIPTFEAGRLKGLGLETSTTLAQASAWESTLEEQKKKHPNPLTFPVYHSWTFTTGEDSFDSLVSKLFTYRAEKTAIDIDVTHMGNGLDYTLLQNDMIPERKKIGMAAAVRGIAHRKETPFPHSGDKKEKNIYDNLKTLLSVNPVFGENMAEIDGSSNEQNKYDNDDPWVTPPVYGAKHVMATSLDETENEKNKTPWIPELNLDVRYRAAAGLGKKIIQQHQEEFSNRAWKQVELVQEMNRKIHSILASSNTLTSTQSRTYDWMNSGSSKFIANMMQKLPNAKDMTIDGVSLSSVLQLSGIPQSFASASFQLTTERVAKLVAVLDPTTVMENIAERQILVNQYKDPDFSIPLETFERFVNIFYNIAFEFVFKTQYSLIGRCLDVMGNSEDLSNLSFVRRFVKPDACDGKDDIMKYKPYAIIPRSRYDYYYTRCFHNYSGTRIVFPTDYNDDKYEKKYSSDEITSIYECIFDFLNEKGFDNSCYGYVYDDLETDVCSEQRTRYEHIRVFGLASSYYQVWFGNTSPITLLGSSSVEDDLQKKRGVYFVNLGEVEKFRQKRIQPDAFQTFSNQMLPKDIREGNLKCSRDFIDGNKSIDHDSFSYHPDYYMKVDWRNYKVVGTPGGGSSLLSRYMVFHTKLNAYEDAYGSAEDKRRFKEVQNQVVTHLKKSFDYIMIKPSVLKEEIQCFSTPKEYFDFLSVLEESKENEHLSIFRMATSMKELLAVMKKTAIKEEKVEPIDDAKVVKLQAAIKDDENYRRMAEVATNYYRTFLSNDDLQSDYIDKLLSSKYPIMSYPVFPEPTYYYLKSLSDKFILPCVDELPDNSIAVFQSNPAFMEAYLCGMNTEMGRELLWREYPTDQRGSYFRKFWDSETSANNILNDNYFDVGMLHTWNGHLGENSAQGKGSLLIFAIKGNLIQQFPDTQVYLHKAAKLFSTKNEDEKHDREDWFSKDANAEVYPVMQAYLRDDLYIVGFNKMFDEVLGIPPDDSGISSDMGYMLTFRQKEEDLSFMISRDELPRLRNAVNSAQYSEILIDKPTRYGIHMSHFINPAKQK